MPTVLTRDQIQAIEDTQFEWVLVPEWSAGDPEAGLWVKGLSGTDRDSFEMSMLIEKKEKGRTTQEVNLRNLRAKLVVRSAFDSDDPETAKPIFTVFDEGWLGDKSAAALQRVYSVAQRLSGLSPEDVEELTKGLGEDQSGDSGSGSPLTLVTPQSEQPSEPSTAESSLSGSSSTPSSHSESEG